MRQALGLGLLFAVFFCGLALVLAAEPAKPKVVEAAEKGAADAGAVDASTTVTVSVRSAPTKAVVYWGQTNLGLTPVSVERPRDSGPMDLTLRASGYFPVHTRAYTFENDALTVRMTPRGKSHTLFGYQEPIPPDGGVGEEDMPPDGGVVAPAPDAVAPTP